MSIKRNSAPGMYTVTRLLRFVELARNWFVQEVQSWLAYSLAQRMRYCMEKRSLHSRVASWLITLLVAACVYAVPVARAWLPGLAAVAGPVIRFEPLSSTVQPGAVFVVNVVVDNVADLGGYDLTVSFNPAVVHVQTVTLGSFLGSTGRTVGALGPSIDNAAGSFTFGGFSFGATAGPNGTGTVGLVTLQAMAPGTTDLTFGAAQVLDTQAQVLGPLTMTSGSVAVSGATATGTPTVVATPTVTRTPLSGPNSIYLPVLRKAML
jgi:hypothetical protein